MIGKSSISNLPSIWFDGEYRVLGCLPETPESKSAFPKFGEGMAAPLDPSQWQEIDFSWYKPPILNQAQSSSCFPKGTRIRMADGTERKIEDIKLLDSVLTAEGNIGKVTNLFVREESSHLLKLRVWGHSHLKMTKEHPVLTRQGYVEAKDLKPGDYVAMPRFCPHSVSVIQTDEHIPVARHTVARKRVSSKGIPGRQVVNFTYCSPPSLIHLNAKSGRILGLFLAEGNTNKCCIEWHFGSHEEHTLASELVSLIKEEWDAEAHLAKRGDGHIKVTLFGSNWAKLFESLCSTGSGHKKLHADLIGGPREFLEALFQGWIDGDGYERRNSILGTTISHDLAINMYDIAQYLGKRPSIRLSFPKVSHGVKRRMPKWDVDIGTIGEDNYRCELEEKCAWRKIREVVREDFSGYVYNFEVQGDNSYVAEGIGVHNCVGHAACSGMEMCWLQSGKPLREFSPWFLYGLINNGRDQGAMISSALTALQATGISLKDDVPYGTMFRNQFSQQAFQNASKYKLLQAYRCATFASICSAITLGYICPLGIQVGSNFANVDSDAVAPLPAGGGGGHCILGVGLKKSSKYGWLIKIQNSWTDRFGNSGYAYIHQGHFRSMEPDAFAIQSISPNDDDTPVLSMASIPVEDFLIKMESAANVGYDSSMVSDVLSKFGEDSLAIIVEAARMGLSTTSVTDIIYNFGPSVLRDLVGDINKRRMSEK